MATSTDLVFFVNGKKNVLHDPDPEMTLLQYLRSDLLMTGTKMGCGEGGCGACTVMVSFSPPDSETAVRHYSANACLLPLCSLHGMAVTTVEGIGSLRTRMHPAQERIASGHGTQCGFCIPGFVMSMYTLLRESPVPSSQQLDTVFDGNLCRCTGYRPIMDAYRPFTQGGPCAMGAVCCRNKTQAEQAVPNDTPTENDALNGTPSEDAASSCNATQLNSIEKVSCVGEKRLGHEDYDPSQEPIFPPFLKVNGKELHSQSLAFVGPRVRWYRPGSLTELLGIKKEHPDCKLVIGNTEIGVEVKVKKQPYPVLVSAASVPQLTLVQRTEAGLQLGASVTLATMDTALKDAVKELPEEQCRVFAAFVEMLRWFAGHQVRNVASLGGNIMTASPISDLNPLLLACGAMLTLASTDGTRRELRMDNSFIQGYRKTAVLASEVLVSVLIPFSKKNEYFYGYKQSTRKEDGIAIVNAGMRVVLDDAANVTDLSLAFGGLSYSTVMATTTMSQLQKQPWNEELLDKACELLTSDLILEPGSPGGNVEYRRTLAVSFFFKFYLTVLRQLQQQGRAPQGAVKSSDRLATVTLERGPVQGVQWFESSPDALSPDSALRQPVVNESAYKHATGESVYVDDITPIQGELNLAVVLSCKAHAKLVGVDPSVALTMPGVVDYISHVDVPGTNMWGMVRSDEEVFATDKVVHRGQVIGAILADTAANAKRAANAVTVQYDTLEPIISIADAITKDSFFPDRPMLSCGDVEAALSGVEKVVEGNMHVEAQEHFYMEPQSAVGYPSEDGGLEMHCTSQCLHFMQSSVSATLGLPMNKIKMKARRLGGAFGGKESRTAMISLPVAVAVHKHNRPVRCVLERDQDMMMTGTRHPFLGKYKMGFTSSGKILAYDVFYYLNAGATTDMSVAVREINMYQEGDTTHTKQVLTECNVRRCWNDVRDQSQFRQRRKEVDLFNSENRWRKRGIAVTPTKFGLGFHEPFMNKAAALVNVYTDGTVLISHGGVEMGQGLHTKIMQVAGQVLGVPLSKIRVDETSTAVIPNASSTAASLSSDLYGAAVADACKTLKERLQPLQTEHPDHTWDQQILAAFFDRVPMCATGFYKTPYPGFNFETGEGQAAVYFTFGSACSVVEVDCLTGDHQVLSTDIVMDVGKSLNPAIDIGQIEGGFLQGYGMLMLEQYKVQADGTLLTRGPSDYKVPSVGNIPQNFNVTLLRESGNPKAIYSSKGIGEPPLLLASSVLCATYDAVAAARRDEGLNPFTPLHTPATPARIRMACADRFSKMYEGAEEKSGKTPWFVDL